MSKIRYSLNNNSIDFYDGWEVTTYANVDEIIMSLIKQINKENQQLKSQLEQRDDVIDKCKKFVTSLSSKGRDCMIYADVKKDILDILNKRGGTDE